MSDACLKGRTQRARSKLPVERDDDHLPAPPQLDVTASLARLHVPHFGKGGDDGGTAYDRERRAHAESRTVAMIGGSTSSGGVSPSKYSSSASRRFASASSMVLPWLATSTSSARATYHSPSCVTTAVNRTPTHYGCTAALVVLLALRGGQAITVAARADELVTRTPDAYHEDLADALRPWACVLDRRTSVGAPCG